MQDLCPTKAMPTHHFSPRWTLRFLASMAGLVLAGAAQAELADKDKPMNIEADSLRYEDTRQTSVFTGNVLITKGTIVMRGSKMDVRQDPQGNQFGVVTGTAAAPGFFRQKREGLDEWIEGEGERIEYDGKAQTVVFTGSAVLRRYRGTQLNDESVGNQITYNSLTEVFTVKGGPANRTAANPSGPGAGGAGTHTPPTPPPPPPPPPPPAGGGRAMLTPFREAEAPPAPAATDPAQLRPSTNLNEKKK